MDLLVMVPYPEQELSRLQAAAGSLQVEAIDPDAPAAQLRKALEQTKAVIGEPPVELLQDLPNLEWIQMTWAGADRYTNDPAFPRHITLTNASGAYGATIAEHAIAMLLALYRRLPGYLRQQRQTQWMDLGAEMALDGQTVVILGAGNIGRETARRLRGFDTTVVGVRRSGAAMMPEFTSVTGIENLERLLPQADVLIGCLPDTPQTRGLLSRERLAQLKPGAVFINVGRGTLVDTQALTEALQSGHLAGAGLDVTDPEPLPPGHPLWQMEQVILTPHVAGVGFGHLPATERRIRNICLENVRRYAAGRPLENVVDFSTGYRSSN